MHCKPFSSQVNMSAALLFVFMRLPVRLSMCMIYCLKYSLVPILYYILLGKFHNAFHFLLLRETLPPKGTCGFLIYLPPVYIVISTVSFNHRLCTVRLCLHHDRIFYINLFMSKYCLKYVCTYHNNVCV